MDAEQSWRTQTEALGAFIRAQRRLADLSLREMATLTHVSNAYLSQVERGLHQPSVRILSAIAGALHVSPDALLAEAGLIPHAPVPAPAPVGERNDRATDKGVGDDDVCPTESAILADPRLTDEQRKAVLGVYRSFTSAED